ncbi:MAG: cobalamin biosynthesis protein CobW [Bradyrhizobium sp.]|nr:cobalamin biosynthesis protein CobW [Bradyrhizobium sp.]
MLHYNIDRSPRCQRGGLGPDPIGEGLCENSNNGRRGSAVLHWLAIVPQARSPTRTHEVYGDRRQEIVFIGTDMDRHAITARLDACLVRGEPGMHIAEWSRLSDPFPKWLRADETA